MAQNSNNIINHWSFLAFAGEFGKVINKQVWTPEEGSPFATLSFRLSKDDTKAKYVHFSSKLGELSKEQLKTLRNELQVIQREVDAETLARRAAKGQQLETYILCKKGQIDFGEDLSDIFD